MVNRSIFPAKPYWLVIAFGALLMGMSHASRAQLPFLTINTEEYPPFNFQNAQGEVDGTAPRVVVDFAEHSYERDIARARTFGFMQDVEFMQANGLALGGSLANAIVMDEHRVLNSEGLRYADEFVKHKVLDAIGDLYLWGVRCWPPTLPTSPVTR